MEFITDRLKAADAGFPDANLFFQRERALDRLKAKTTTWRDIKQRIKLNKQKKDEARKAAHPGYAESVISCVEAWNTSATNREWRQKVDDVHRRTVREKAAAPTKAEYEDVLTLIHGCITVGNAARGGQVGSIRNADYWQRHTFGEAGRVGEEEEEGEEGEKGEEGEEEEEEGEEEGEEKKKKAEEDKEKEKEATDEKKELDEIGGAVITLTSEEGRHLKTGKDQCIYLTLNHLDLVEKYLDIKEEFFGDQQVCRFVSVSVCICVSVHVRPSVRRRPS